MKKKVTVVATTMLLAALGLAGSAAAGAGTFVEIAECKGYERHFNASGVSYVCLHHRNNLEANARIPYRWRTPTEIEEAGPGVHASFEWLGRDSNRSGTGVWEDSGSAVTPFTTWSPGDRCVWFRLMPATSADPVTLLAGGERSFLLLFWSRIARNVPGTCVVNPWTNQSLDLTADGVAPREVWFRDWSFDRLRVTGSPRRGYARRTDDEGWTLHEGPSDPRAIILRDSADVTGCGAVVIALRDDYVVFFKMRDVFGSEIRSGGGSTWLTIGESCLGVGDRIRLPRIFC
ncbi:MAG: hypothetical protein OXH70_17165 [Acidobacteria bacterium]|nr:hypothetical protein [Acidobacteriota bacterium]